VIMPPPHVRIPSVPWTVQVAAACLVLYGVGVLINAARLQSAIGWESVEPREFGRAVLRCVAMGLIAWGLVTRQRWAWWTGVVVPGVFLVAGWLAFAALFWFKEEAPEEFPTYWIPYWIVSLSAVTVAVVLLLLPVSRRAFDRPAS
jgi:hypothetical protein